MSRLHSLNKMYSLDRSLNIDLFHIITFEMVHNIYHIGIHFQHVRYLTFGQMISFAVYVLIRLRCKYLI